jgi:hypothetical protein
VFQQLVGVKAVEDAAIEYVMDLETQAGRHPEDRRYDVAFAGDIWSPPRTIEVEAVGGDQRGWFVPLESAQYQAAGGDANFFLYVVDNVRQGDPSQFRLKVFGRDRLHRLLQNAKKREYYELPIPVAEFDSAPGAEDIKPSKNAGSEREERLSEFTKAMLDIYRNAKKQASYDAKVFLGMVLDRGGYETAQYLIHTDKPSDGYTALYERGRLDLTVEALVVRPEWSDLFSEDDRERARDRLREYGYGQAK